MDNNFTENPFDENQFAENQFTGNLFAGVITGNKTDSTDRVFTYGIPEEMKPLIRIGQRVIVPFGMNSKQMEGYVVELLDSIDFSPKKLKNIIEIMEEKPVLTESQIKLSTVISEKIPCRRLDMIKAMIPSINRIQIEQNTRFYFTADFGLEMTQGKVIARNIELKKLKGKTDEIYRFISENQGIDVEKIKEKFSASTGNLNTLERKALIRYEEEAIYRNVEAIFHNQKDFILSDCQNKALEEIRRNFESGKNVLLCGVTGSGKTEVYFELIEEVLLKNQSCIFLVPEIALTTQMMARVRARFGEMTAIFHSGLTEAERLDQWRLIRNGQVKLAIGPRSAVFLPFETLGLIIIDEEHENAYKSETVPKYDAREVAEARGIIENCKVIRGSATPSVETFYRAETGEMGLVELNERIGGNAMAVSQIVDMREELLQGNKSPFSRELIESLQETISSGKQAILFLNRRGHSTFVSCRDCGEPLKCPHCSVSLTFHDRGRLVCHYCSYETAQPEVCPKCKSKRIKYFGTGTQKIQEEFEKIFGEGIIVRMDADSTAKRGSHGRIIQDFAKGKYKVMLGTQMVAKGLDFPNVTLVAVLTADTMINLPDFRSGERSFQIISQVSGRAGRGEHPGKVIIQTYTPENYSVVLGASQNYRDFYQEEIAIRRIMDLPPFREIAIFRMQGLDQKLLEQSSLEIKKDLELLLKKIGVKAVILGPATSPTEKVKDNYRYQMLLKYKKEDSTGVREILQLLGNKREEMKGLALSIETNPYNML